LPPGSTPGPEHRLDLGGLPDVEETLLRAPVGARAVGAEAVGVEAREEASLGSAQLALEELDRLLDRPAELRVGPAVLAVGLGVDPQQLALVIEHLLEVGDQPARVGAVAVETAAELVVDAAAGHAVQRQAHVLEGVARVGVKSARQQQRLQVGRCGELGGAPEAAVAPVGLRHQRARQLPERLETAGRAVGRGRSRRQCLCDATRLLLHFATPFGVGSGDRVDHLAPARATVGPTRREVGTAVEGPAVGGAEDVQRPAAGAGQPHHGLHVDLVDVGTLLPVDLDADQALVHEGGGLRVLERFPLHDVAPVAGRVADRDQHRPVLATRALPGLVPPRVPVDRVLAVLAQVGARLGSQTVRSAVGVRHARQAKSGGVTDSIHAL
jgi:hypothetical protein